MFLVKKDDFKMARKVFSITLFKIAKKKKEGDI
jgi:hypothetical protein